MERRQAKEEIKCFLKCRLISSSVVDFDFSVRNALVEGTFPTSVFKLQAKGTTDGMYAKKKKKGIPDLC